jgi:hypothetical protein
MENMNLELLRIANLRAPQDQGVTDVLVLAESLAAWVETRRMPEEAAAPTTQSLQGGL